MLIPIGPVKNIPVTILRVSHDPPQVIEASLIYFDGKSYHVALKNSDESFQEGEQLLVDFGEGSTGRRRTRIRTLSPAVLTLELLGRARPRERREFPRIEGQVNLRYRILGANADDKLLGWLRHPHLTDASEVWQTPDPFMEFSATGLRFQAADGLEPGGLLCLRLELPGVSEKTFHCGAEVVRIDEDGDGTLSVAIAFTHVSDELGEALMEYTRHCQDVLLGLESLHEE